MASRPSGKMLKSLPPDPARHQDSAITRWKVGANTNLWELYQGTNGIVTGVADGSFHAGQGVLNGASSSAYVDGTLTSSLNVGSSSLTGIYGAIGYGHRIPMFAKLVFGTQI